MSGSELFTVSDFGRHVYGVSSAPEDAVVAYGQALMVIAGADGEVSRAEFDWLIDHQRKFGAGEKILAQYEAFDYRSADLEELLTGITVDVSTWSVGPNLIYMAIQMCSADGVYADEERAKVLDAARTMKVPDDIVLTLEALVRLEKAAYDIRTALTHVRTVD